MIQTRLCVLLSLSSGVTTLEISPHAAPGFFDNPMTLANFSTLFPVLVCPLSY